MPFQSRLQDLRALVTGGAAGIGEAVARRLAEEGARVAILDRDAAGAQALAEATGVAFAALDLTDFAAVRAAIDRLGPFDIVVNNAGVDQHAFFTQTTEADWRRLLAINLEAAFCVTHAVLPAMQEASGGW